MNGWIVEILYGLNELLLNLVLLYADRPIASIAFHAQGELLAVASGHKVRFLNGEFDI